MSTDNYTNATKYELFIRNVFQCPRGMKNGADLCFMKNAMSMEEGETFAKHLGSFDKQFKVVKSYIDKALTKILKTKAYTLSHAFFDQQKANLEHASTTTDLMDIVIPSLEEIIKYRNN